NHKKPAGRSFERNALIVLTLIFVALIVNGWGAAMKLRETISANNSVASADVQALIEVERLRNVVESQLSNSRSFFLLGSRSLFDEQKKEQQMIKDMLVNFEQKYSLQGIPEIIRRIEALEQQQQDFFDQGMKYREEKTESKIVGIFYQSKINPIRTNLNKALDEIVALHNAELERNRAEAREAAIGAEVQVPRGMAWFTGMISFLFLSLALLIIRMMKERTRQIAERNRLYEEAQQAVQARDEILAAVSYDLREPLGAITKSAENIAAASDSDKITENAELIKSNVGVAESAIKD